MELRPYQVKAIEMMRAEVRKGNRSVLLGLATGGGKTAIVSEIMRSAWDRGHRSIFFAHRRELVKQTAERFEQYGIPSTILMAGYETDWSVPLVIASQQSWEMRRQFLDGNYQLIIFDEAHIGVKRQQRIIEDIKEVSPNAVVLGVTATPMTNSGPGLGSIYKALVQPVSMQELVDEGYLVPLEHYLMRPIDWHPATEIELNSTGEYDAEAVKEWFKREAILGDIVTNYMEHFMGRKGIVFARTREMSVWIAEKFGREGIPAAHVDFATPDKERKRILDAYRAGDILVLTNVDVFSEGFDVPDVDLAILATPIRSIPRYVQRVGRVMRPAPGKEFATVVDHGGVLTEHGPVTRYQYWALEDPHPDRSNPLHALKQVKRDKERRCPMCGTTFKAGFKECPECGYDFHHLPPGYEPPIEPAIMVKYDEAMRMQRLGITKRCKGISLPPGYTLERFWAELLGKYEEKLGSKRPWKKGFLQIIFYATTCYCLQDMRDFDPWATKPAPPGAFVDKAVRIYFMKKQKGYFNWGKDGFPCWRKR